MCATTLIMDNEVEADWLDLLRTWLDGYQNPADDSLLYTFVLKVAQAEWQRLRVQREYDFHMFAHGTPPIGAWQPDEIKNHDLIVRYLTTAERRVQREYRMLENHWKSHHKPLPEPKKSAPPPDPDPAETPMPEILYVNNDTGESVDDHGNYYPPPPDYVSRPIIPGVYDPDHPAYPRHSPERKHRR
jgi:hypothetical protein